MFEDDEIQDSRLKEQRRKKTDPANWERLARDLARAVSAKDQRRFWEMVKKAGIEPGSRYYDRLVRYARKVF